MRFYAIFFTFPTLFFAIISIISSSFLNNV